MASYNGQISTMETKRMAVYAKDIQKICGKSDSYARRVMREMRRDLGKQKHHIVSVYELCEYFNLREVEVLRFLGR